MPDSIAYQILELLEIERRALCAGDFIVLDTLLQSKTQLLERLQSNGLSGPDVAKIKEKLTENQSLLSAAIDGVGAARDRLAALESVRESLNTYDQAGQMAKVATKRPVMEKKA